MKELKDRKIADLNKLARDLGIEGSSSMRKQELIFAILQGRLPFLDLGCDCRSVGVHSRTSEGAHDSLSLSAAVG